MKLESVTGGMLRARGWTLSVAESCTGGLVCDRITNVPGSSGYFEGGIVSYSNLAKARRLSIPGKVIKRYGPVSPQIAKRMAEGVRRAFRTHVGLSTTGIAGPAGGTKKTPLGTVFISFSDGKRTWVKKVNLKGTRREIKKEASEETLQFLQDCLIRHGRQR
jgi:nicotinamide-nucleotide amidase